MSFTVGRRRRAELRLNPAPHYRRDAFAAGLEGLGFDPVAPNSSLPEPGDVLVLWNRYLRDEMRARAYEKHGGTVLITENAWLGPEEKDRHLFALCRGHHNGAGSWHVGAGDRWSRLGLDVKPWRAAGDHLLLLPQRGMGEEGVKMPRTWLRDVQARLTAKTRMPVKIREHPGQRPHPEIDFDGVYAAITWGSGAAIKAIVAGVPVFHELRKWIGAPGARFGIDALDDPFLGDRTPMLHRLAWAQWSAEEIALGEPFQWLLNAWPSTSIAVNGEAVLSAGI